MCEALRELMKEEIEEELKKNHEQGIEQGRINQLIDLVMQNLLPIETAAQCANMTLDEFKVAIEYSRAAEPPVQCGVSHLSRRTEPHCL